MANIQNNRLSASLSANDVQDILAAIQTIESKLPFIIGLTTEERKTLPKINRQNKLFVDDALQACMNNATLLPNYISVGEMQKDYELYRSLEQVLQPLAQLYEKVRDTQMLAGSEAFSSALMVYKMFQMAAGVGMPGMETIVAQLAERFNGQGGTANEEPAGE
ncbi:MAG: hypothetical protein ACKVTZ_05985 [Bacteroidia bacterium]